MLLFAIHTQMTLGHVPYRCRVMQGLEERIGVRVQDIRLETTVFGSVVEAATIQHKTLLGVVNRYLPEVKVFDTKLGVFDLDLSIVLGYLTRSSLK